jgi:hypothetical protein
MLGEPTASIELGEGLSNPSARRFSPLIFSRRITPFGINAG